MASIANVPECVQLMENLTIETVTPEMAEVFIASVDTVPGIGARKFKQVVIDRLFYDIIEGLWIADIDSFKFDVNGVLRDGNNRCRAIIEAGVAVPVMIRRKCTEEYLARVDTGTSRTTTHVLQIHDVYNPTMTGRALTLQWQYENMYLPGSRQQTRIREGVRRVDNTNILTHLYTHSRIVDSVKFIEAVPGLKGLGSLGEFAWCHYAISNVNPGSADSVTEFFRRLAQGIYGQPKDVLISLRSRLFNSANSAHRGNQTQRLPDGQMSALILKGWNLWVQGIEKEVLRWTPDPVNAMTNEPTNFGEVYPHPIQAE